MGLRFRILQIFYTIFRPTFVPGNLTFKMMDARYPKTGKLKSRKLIESLFAARQSVAKFPLRLAYMELPEGSTQQMGVSVSKKYFKRAHDRNYYKRVLRECYRTNKSLLETGKPYAFMLMYQTSERMDFHQIHELTVALFGKFAARQSDTIRDASALKE